MNVIDYPPLRFARAEAATMRQVFRHVTLLALPAAFAGADGGNLVLVGSDAALDHPALASALTTAGDHWGVLDGAAVDAWIGDAEPLRDDHAPVDQLITR
jgi:hypothetical protein